MKSEIVQYMNSDLVRSRFAEVLTERNAGAYISSVLLMVANTPALQECTPQSIYTSALRAATLRLSVDPVTKQAYLVPFNSKNGKQATLIVGYKGLHDMAMRTGKYRRIDVYPIYEGMSIAEDIITGTLSIQGGKQSDRIAGWFAIFEFTRDFGGAVHHVYMTIEEIHEHARKWSKGYNREDGFWKTSTRAMEKKTVLRRLLMDWGYIDPTDAAVMHNIEDDVVDGDIVDVPELPEDEQPETEPEKLSEKEIMEQLGF